MKKVLVLMSSARKGANTDLMADEFIRGAQEAGHEVEKIMVARLNIKGCIGCRMCRAKGNRCVQKDDMTDLYDKLLAADVIAFASPVYFYNVNAQMKLLMDRTFAIEPDWKDKKAYLITTGAAPIESYYENIKMSFRNYISCFPNMTEGGIILGGGTMEKQDIKQHTTALQQCYEQGKMV